MNRRDLFALSAATAASAMAASRFDPARIRTRKIDKVETVFDSPGPAPNGLQATRDGLWIIDQGAGNKAYLVTYEGGKVLRSFEIETDKSSGITFDGEALWIGSTYSREIVRCSATTGKALERHFTPGAGVIYKMAGDPASRASPLAKSRPKPAAPPAAAAQVGGFQAGEVLGSKTLGTGAHGQEWKDGKFMVRRSSLARGLSCGSKNVDRGSEVSHRGPDWRESITNSDLYDWEKVTRLLAEQAPDWVPGTEPGYHSVRFGYLVGEVVRRVTGRSLGTVFRQEIVEPLGADFYIGLPASEDARVADLIPPPGPPVRHISVDVMATRTREWRGAEIPAIGGTGNARAIAGTHAILANGGVANGKRFLSEAGCRKALEVQVSGRDRILGFPTRNGLGFAVSGGVFAFPNQNTIYWGGYGGSLAVIDMDAHISIGYAMNKMLHLRDDMRALGLAMEVWKAQG